MTTFEGDTGKVLDRNRDLRVMRTYVDEAQGRGEPAIIRISGPPGIGKSAFLRHALARTPDGAKALWVTAEPGDRTQPGAAVRRLVHPVAVAPDSTEDEISSALRVTFAKHHTLCIDDAQWLDEVSRRILVNLVHYGSPSIVLLGDRREHAPELMPHQTIHLAPLRPSSMAQLVRDRFPGARRALVDEIVASASGLPFAALFLAAQAERARARSASDADVSVGSAIARRLERCSDSAREAIRHGAFLEGSVDLLVVARALNLGLRDVAHTLTELVDLATVENLRIVFRHAVIAEAIRASIADPMPYYARLLETFDDDDDRPETLAARLRCAQGCGADDIAASCALQIGRKLAAASSLETSLDYITTALAHAGRPLPVEYSVEYAGVLLQLARDERAAAFVREQIRSAIQRDDAAAIAELLTSFFSAAVTLERFKELETLCDRAEAMKSADESALRRVRSVRLAAFAFGGRLDDYTRNAAQAPLAWVDHRPAAFVAALLGDDQCARASFETYQGGLRSEHARQEPTDRVLQAMIGLFEAGTTALANIDEIGRSVRAQPSATGLRIAREIANGNWAAAASVIDDIPLWDETFEEPYESLGWRLLFTALTGRPVAEARRTLRVIREMIGRGQIRHAAVPARLYFACATSSERSAPPDIAAFVRETLGVAPMPYLVSGLPLSIALVAPGYGVSACTDALDCWPPFRSRWHRAHLDLAYGLVAGDDGRLRAARDAFDALNAPAYAAISGVALPVPRAKDAALADALGLRRKAEPGKPLTARERDVAELAASGMGNREIAVALRISERTVEVHLTNVFRKLGVPSRSALAQRLLRS
ncbi:MAG TPA: LuxR C-terminal-related transcriptional regulator [Candidatus Elarobacter sp.]|nr:LuxR C-terminal-related transcriptional regulator [Candidatus Elarobacter sp.]